MQIYDLLERQIISQTNEEDQKEYNYIVLESPIKKQEIITNIRKLVTIMLCKRSKRSQKEYNFKKLMS